MAEPQRTDDELEDIEAHPALRAIEGGADGESDPPGVRRNPHAMFQGVAATAWGIGVLSYATRVEIGIVGWLMGAGLVLAGAQHAWRGIRGTAPEWGPIRRWIANVVAVFALVFAVAGVSVTSGTGEPPQAEAAAELTPTQRALMEPVDVPLESSYVDLPKTWKHDPKLGAPGDPAFQAGGVLLQFGLVGIDLPAGEPFAADEFRAGVLATARDTYDDYRDERFERVDLVPGTESYLHSFTMTADGTDVYEHQLFVVDLERSQVWTATAMTGHPLGDQAIARLHDDVAKALPIA